MIRRSTLAPLALAPLALALFSGLPVQAAPAPAHTLTTEIAQPAAGASIPWTAQATARLAMLDLRLVEAPTEDDYRIADLLLSLASDQAPENTELLRRRIEAAWNAGRSEEAITLTRKLITLDPTDTVAQLRLISATVGRKQTARERLEIYAKFIASDKIDASVRSRLAVDACLLCREQGDGDKFREYLRNATILDSSNKEAAVLAVSTYAQDRPTDSVGIIELYSNLLMADPLDPAAYLSLADLFAKQGAFEQANRMHALARDLLKKTGGEITQLTEVEALVLEWQVDGPEKVNKRISLVLESQRRAVADYNKSVRDTGIGVGRDLGEPEDIRLGGDTEKVRLATAIAADKAEAVQASLKDMAASAEFKRKLATNDRDRPPGLTREQALAQADAALLDLQYWRVIAGVDVDKVEADLAIITAESGEDEPGPDIVRALLLLRQNKAEEALATVDKILADLPDGQLVRTTCEYARGLALEALGRKDEALTSLRAVQRASPTRPVGAMARYRIERIIGGRDAFSPDRAAVVRIADGIPKWVDEMISQPKTFMSVLGEAAPQEAYGDATGVTVILRNISPIPMSVGSDRPLNSQFMFSPVLNSNASRFAPLMRPEIFEVDRRLRLMPRETLRTTVYPTLGYAGFLIDLGCATYARINWRLLQGFSPAANGNFQAGPLSLAVESNTITREGLPEARLATDELVKFIASATEENVAKVILVGRERLWRQSLNLDLERVAEEIRKASAPKAPSLPTNAAPVPPSGPAVPADPAASPAATPTAPATPPFDFAAERKAVVDALVAIYPKLSAKSRAALAASMPHAGQIAEVAPLDAIILADQDPTVRPIALISRIKQSDDATLAACIKHEDPRIAELATLLTARLTRSGTTYSRLIGGLPALRGEVGAIGE